MVKNWPANAGDTGSIPDGRDPICHRTAKPHASQLLSQHFRACAPQQEKPPQGEALKPQQSSLRPLQLDPAQPKIKLFFFKEVGVKEKEDMLS